MPRVGRIKYDENDAWYHLYSRIAAHEGEYPLSEPVPMRRLIQVIKHFSEKGSLFKNRICFNGQN